MLPRFNTLGCQQKDMGHKEGQQCTYYSMPKGTSWAEATLNSEKIKPIALAVIELGLPEGRQAVESFIESFF